MIWLLAQLVEPALQPGPVRLPGQAPLVQPQPPRPQPAIELSPELRESPLTDQEELSEELERCQNESANTPSALLERCAAAMTAQLVQRGYINSRVVVDTSQTPARLELIEGKLVELRVTGPDKSLNEKSRKLLSPLQGRAFNLPALETALQRLRQQPDVASMRANLGRLGSDRSKAILHLTLTPTTHPWEGQLSLRNDGNAGSGEGRALLIVNKQDFAQKQDQLLFIGELDSDKDPELGYLLGSLSYMLPITNTVQFTGAFGISRRNLIEHPQPLHDLSYRQLQGYGQLNWNFAEGLSHRSYAFAGLSLNRNDSYLGDKSVPLVAGGGSNGSVRTGFLRAGIGTTGRSSNLNWVGQLYGLQGIAGLSTDHQLNALADFGIRPGQSQAFGVSAIANWLPMPQLQITARAAGQAAFNALPNDMGFSLGSDSGLKGLPGQFISGDSGYLGSLEAAYTLWKGQNNRLQLVPFLGAGEIRSVRRSLEFEDTAGAGGVVARWLQGKTWSLELGWVSPFETGERGVWDDWFLSQGLYTKLELRF